MADLNNLWLSAYKHPGKSKEQVKQLVNESSLRKFQRPIPPTAPIVGDIGEYQADLSFFDQFARFNGGNKVILNLIHVPSRFLYSYLLKTKSQAADKLIEIIPTLNPPMTDITLDAGTEWLNKKMSDFFKAHNITTRIVNKSETGDTPTLSSYSMGIVERVNKTVRDLIMRYLSEANQTGADKYRYEPIFNKLIDAYNTSPHSALHNISPAEYLSSGKYKDFDADGLARAEDLWAKIKRMFPTGSYVVVQVPSTRFQKGSVAKFSDNVYRVIDHISYRVIIEDAEGHKLSKLYHELRPAAPPANDFKIKPESHKELKKLQKELNVYRTEAREGIDRANIIPPPINVPSELKVPTRSQRERKPNVRLRDL